jgi:type IV pilus assembly protein PilM
MSLKSLLSQEVSMPSLRRPERGRSGGGRPTLGGPTLSMPALGRKKDTGEAAVGLEIEAGSVAAVEMKTEGGLPRLVAAGVQPLAPDAFRDGEVAEPDAVAEALRALFGTHGMSKRVRLGIANQRLVVRTLRLPAIEDPAELDAAVRFSAQEEIAMPLDEAMIEHRVVGGAAGSEEGPAQIDVMVVAARKEMIQASLRPLRDAGLEPVGIDLSAFGMIRALGDIAPVETVAGDATEPAGHTSTLYCNIGDTTNLAVARGRSCLFTRVSPVGLEDVIEGLASTTGLSPEHAGMWLNHVGLSTPLEQIEGDPATVERTRDALELGATSLVDELRLSLDFYAAQDAAVPVERIVLCGPGSAIPGLAEQLEPAVGLPIVPGVPHALTGYDAATAARLTLPFGIALDN